MTIKRLKKLEEQSRKISQKQDVTSLKKQIYDLTTENQKLKKRSFGGTDKCSLSSE